MEQIGAHGVVELTTRESGGIVVSLAQIEKVTFVFPAEERCVPDESPFGTKVQGVTRRKVLAVEISWR